MKCSPPPPLYVPEYIYRGACSCKYSSTSGCVSIFKCHTMYEDDETDIVQRISIRQTDTQRARGYGGAGRNCGGK
jgi:hypothetical protein